MSCTVSNTENESYLKFSLKLADLYLLWATPPQSSLKILGCERMGTKESCESCQAEVSEINHICDMSACMMCESLSDSSNRTNNISKYSHSLQLLCSNRTRQDIPLSAMFDAWRFDGEAKLFHFSSSL